MSQNFDDIYVELHLDNIYSGNIGKMYLYSSSPFCLKLCESVSIVAMLAGKFYEGKILSIASDGKYIIKINTLGCIHEKLLNVAKGGTGVESYGMQYYPFVSSEIKFDMSILGGNIKAISIMLPDKYRVIWFGENVFINNKKLNIFHSQGRDESTYIFRNPSEILLPMEYFSNFNNVLPKQDISFNIPVRFGAKEFLKLITIPTLYSFLSGLGLIVLLDNIQAVIGAMITFWAFIVKLFNNASPPQANVILRDIYVLYTINLTVLTLFIIFIPDYWIADFIGQVNISSYLENIYSYIEINKDLFIKFHKYFLLLSIFIFSSFLTFGFTMYISILFHRKGYFPKCIENYIYCKRKKNERKNKKAILIAKNRS